MTAIVMEDTFLRHALYASVCLTLAMSFLHLLRAAISLLTDPRIHAGWKMAAHGAGFILNELAKRMTSRHADPDAPRSRPRLAIDRALKIMGALVLLVIATWFAVQGVLALLITALNENASATLFILASALFLSFLAIAKMVGVKAIDDLRDLM